ncbi:MAG: hypothetical protein ACE5R4_06790 [Armatimonadota bacterium]
MRRVRMSMAAVLLAVAPASAETALEHLQAAPKPQFREGHTLPPLTRWGWTMPFEVRVELAEHWGYALEFGGYATGKLVAKLDDPESDQSRLCALAAADPKRYPLCVLLHRPCTDRSFRERLPDATWCRDAEGNLIDDKRVWSPEAPDEVLAEVARLSVEPLRKVLARAPVAVVLNGGEYGLNVFGWSGKAWQRDPRIMEAKGEQSWFDYISAHKARQELPVTKAVRQANPEGLYIYYHTFAAHRKRYGAWWTWSYSYDQLRKITDLPSSSVYYRHFNSGWAGGNDMLTQALNSVAQQMQHGDALSYNWMNAGWTREKLGAQAEGDLDRYTGYLKCYYTAGMIGGCAGYFAYPKGGFGGDLGEQPPHWLRQMMVLARVHALFSHLEEFLREGDLLPGPNAHRWSKDLPAYELPTGDEGVRVLARRHRQREEWLLTAWAATGDDREVTVEVPDLGEVRLHARACGSVYRATRRDGEVSLRLVDEDGMLPTAGL